MKKLAIALLLSALAVPATANEITSIITDSVSLTVQGGAIQSQRIGSTYGVSGSNVAVTTLGGLTGSTASSPATISAGDYDVNGTGAFTFTESQMVGDTAVTSQTASAGTIASPNLYSDSTTQFGGTAGTLAGTVNLASTPTVTAGGAGTTAVGQRTVEMSVFQ